jgi:hypothetical protein
MSLTFALLLGRKQIGTGHDTAVSALKRFGDHATQAWVNKSQRDLHWQRDCWN